MSKKVAIETTEYEVDFFEKVEAAIRELLAEHGHGSLDYLGNQNLVLLLELVERQ